MRAAVVSAVLIGGLTCGCAVGGAGAGGDDPSSTPSTAPSSGPGGSSPLASVCADVRAGIDAFNAGDFDETKARFQQAVPKAKRLRAGEPSRSSRLLLQAVRYYAALPAEDYPEASRGSAEFQRWKAVTLTLCVSGQDQLSPGPQDPQDSAIPA